jgi:dTDP-4-amino-4,6-dideoxygalactose transaminase
MTQIPFLDLATPHQELKEELTAVFHKLLSTASFIGGPVVEDFEAAFAEFCDSRYCVGVGSGTDALRFALMAAGVESGDVVLSVPNTFIATGEAISQVGAVPEFVDVDERFCTMDPEQLRKHLALCVRDPQTGKPLSGRTGQPITAIVPVHLYGHPADMDAILQIAEEYGLIVIEDACQAHGAEYFSRRNNRWMKAGSMGLAAAFSFYPGKNLGACGEAGAVTTNDATIAAKIRMIRDHGQSKKYYHSMEGYNGRLDTLQAGMLKVKLAHLSRWNAQRRANAARYDEWMSDLSEIGLPQQADWAKSVYHLYVVRVEDREEVMAHLNGEKIGTGIHYPIPLHLQDAYRHLNYRKGDFPVSEKLAPQILSLPMFPQLTAEQQQIVVRTLQEAISVRADSLAFVSQVALLPSSF